MYAEQRWSHLAAIGDYFTQKDQYGNLRRGSTILDLTPIIANLPENWTMSACEHCDEIVIWLNEIMIYPKTILVEQPNEDLTEEIKRDYLEAASVLSDSARSAAAILRLALQKLCVQLGEKGDSINDDIAALVKKGLNPVIQKSLDSLRITGNNAVHPGELDLTEDTERVVKLFGILNFIAEKMITEPKEIDSFYDSLPASAKEQVEKRDEL